MNVYFVTEKVKNKFLSLQRPWKSVKMWYRSYIWAFLQITLTNKYIFFLRNKLLYNYLVIYAKITNNQWGSTCLSMCDALGFKCKFSICFSHVFQDHWWKLVKLLFYLFHILKKKKKRKAKEKKTFTWCSLYFHEILIHYFIVFHQY